MNNKTTLIVIICVFLFSCGALILAHKIDDRAKLAIYNRP
jgi:hypothetical protein